MSTTTTDASTAAATEADADYFDPIILHFVPKVVLTESAVLGTEMIALCGERWTADDTDYAATAGVEGWGKSVVCPLCGDMFSTLAGEA